MLSYIPVRSTCVPYTFLRGFRSKVLLRDTLLYVSPSGALEIEMRAPGHVLGGPNCMSLSSVDGLSIMTSRFRHLVLKLNLSYVPMRSGHVPDAFQTGRIFLGWPAAFTVKKSLLVQMRMQIGKLGGAKRGSRRARACLETVRMRSCTFHATLLANMKKCIPNTYVPMRSVQPLRQKRQITSQIRTFLYVPCNPSVKHDK